MYSSSALFNCNQLFFLFVKFYCCILFNSSGICKLSVAVKIKMSNYAEECLKNYKKLKQTLEVDIDYEIYPNQILVYYYYDNRDYFDLSRTIRNLNRYLQKCNMNLHWKTFADVGIDNLTESNDSRLFLNRSKHLTRLDIKKR